LRYKIDTKRRSFTHTSAAHFIRHDQTRQFQAAASLSAKFRWCLTGTPIHNSLADLGSLISFLRVPLLQRKLEFYKHVSKPIEENKGGDPVKNLRLILQSLCLRRTKELISLPEPKEIIYDVHLSLEEKSLYDMVKERANDQIENAISSARGPGTGKAVMQMVMCLRRICNHGTMDRDIQDSVGDETSESGGVTEAKYCPGCECEIMDAGRLTLDNKRLLCTDCYYEWESKASKRGKQKRSSPSYTTPAELNSRLNLLGHSTKVSLLVQDVDKHKDSDKWYVLGIPFNLLKTT
jgi:SWI/SNF-related matrix-associated actin-dependent regulator of chromatin subfamily A3